MATFRDLLSKAKAQITEVDTAEAQKRIQAGGVIVLDVREPDEFDQGALPDVLHIPRGHLEAQIEGKIIDKAAPVVVYCAGYYKAQRADHYALPEMQKHWLVNYDGALLLLDAVLPLMLPQQRGHLSFISSVAGYRGLPQSLAYGPTKAALTNLSEALYMDLQDLGLGVSVVNPGFVATPLTSQNKFEMPALLTPAQAAQHMLQGWRDGVFEIHFPKRFTRWLQLLRVLPYRWYFPLVRRATRM
jgi:short-subunit dehydrogenase